jgi:hypothetical protein
MKLDNFQRRVLKALDFEAVIVQKKDISVTVVGTVHSAFRMRTDANAEVARLNDMYSRFADDGDCFGVELL